MEIKNVKGGYDFLPKEQKIRNYINDTLREVFEEYGYLPIETPILCYYDILSDKYDENNDILKEIYKFNDQGGRNIGLRYDLTVPFAKFIALNKNNITLPFKRYEINKVFRDGPVKVGRDREFTQCDVDVVGLAGQNIEAELMCLYKDAFDRLGIDITIKYNSRKLMNGLIIESGIEKEKLSEVTTIVDKIEKVSKEEFKDFLSEIGIDEEKQDKLLLYFTYTLNELNDYFKETENTSLKEGLEEINKLTDMLNELGLKDIIKFTSSLARGQNYYTGNVFEVYDKKLRLTGSIGGGGRYDNMVTEFISDGEYYPAVGISFGLSSIYEILKTSELFQNKANLNLLIIPLNTDVESLKLANSIRQMGYRVDVEMQGRKLKKSLDYANRENIPYVIILGENEVETKEFKLKNMETGTETLICFDNIEAIKEYMQ